MPYLRFASIDVGSNAVRLLCSYIIETEGEPIFKKGLLARVPIRLGAETFETGKISLHTIENLTECMRGFKSLIKAQEIPYYRAFATSAMREASNQKEVVAHIEKNTGIHIDVISGKREAKLISGRQLPDEIAHLDQSLFVDVGGGSTELSLNTNGEQLRESFDIGTLRLLSKKVEPKELQRMEEWLQVQKLAGSGIPIIGSGGNITRIFKLKKEINTDSYLPSEVLTSFYNEIVGLSIKERMTQYPFNPDRADVIVPAIEIYLRIIKLTGTKLIYVPKSGLSDGMVRAMYREYLEGTLS